MESVKSIIWQIVIERVTVIKFRMDSGGGNGSGCFEVEIWADTAKFTNMIVAGFRMRLRAEWVVMREESCILESCCLSPIRRNAVLEELRVRRFAVNNNNNIQYNVYGAVIMAEPLQEFIRFI